MNENVNFFMGVNGVGKTSLIREVQSHYPDAEHIKSVEILMALFNGVPREELEKLSAEEKFNRMEPAFIQLFDDLRGRNRVLFDTHLVVVIRRGGEAKIENIWSPNYLPYINQAFFLTADPKVISQRRIHDFETTGRKRDPDILHITQEQYLNYDEFLRSVKPHVRSHVVDNTGDFNTQVKTLVTLLS